MGQSLQYSVIIPAFNEEQRISRLLSSLSDPLAEFIFVCDGWDETPRIIEQFAKENPSLTVRCLSFTKRLGKGGGVYEGFKMASAPVIGFIDADNSTQYSDFIRMAALIPEYEGVIGSRYLPDSTIHIRQPFIRQIQSRVFNLIIRCLFGLQYYDTQCGAKVFCKEAIDKILPKMRSKGFEFDVELLWRLNREGYKIKEVPVIWNDTEDSRLRFSDTLSMFLTLFRLRIGIWK